MRSFPVLVLLGALLLGQSASNAGFVVTTSRAPITSGTFAGDTGVTLFIQNDGVSGTGTEIIYYDVTMSAPSGTVNPRFFIRTWDGNIRNTATPSANTQADFGYQGFVGGDANRDGKVTPNDFSILAANFNTPSGATWAIGDFNGDGKVTPNDFSILAANFNSNVAPGSYVRFGTNAQFGQFFSLQFTPAENSQVYTDGQSVTGFEVQALPLDANTAGLPDTALTQLAFAVVPTGQAVTFAGSASGETGPIVPFTITDSGGGLTASAFVTAVPEPASLGLVSLTALALCRSRRNVKTA